MNMQNRIYAPTLFDLLSSNIGSWPFTNTVNESFSCDIEDKGDHYSLKADMPGVKKEDIKLSFQNGVLTIKAVHHQKNGGNSKYILNERFEGTYERSFTFEDVDENNINAAFVKGELDVSLGKIAKSPKLEIKIHQLSVWMFL